MVPSGRAASFFHFALYTALCVLVDASFAGDLNPSSEGATVELGSQRSNPRVGTDEVCTESVDKESSAQNAIGRQAVRLRPGSSCRVIAHVSQQRGYQNRVIALAPKQGPPSV